MALIRLKLYIAGPDIFRSDAVTYAEKQRQICERYGFTPLHPMDNNVGLKDHSRKTARQIFRADLRQIDEADITVANCNYFRGGCIDDGAAVELGYTFAKGKIAYGYIESLLPANQQIPTHYPCHFVDGQLRDKDGYVLVDDLGTAVNLMAHELIEESGGKLVEGDFEAAIRQLREDLDSGQLEY
jgi:nucleoside 2-deoxyribosyltransferase